MAILAGPAIESLNGAGGFARAVGAVSMGLTEARSYAMANNTHVFVGLEETDASQSSLVVPQTPGIGRLFLAEVASTDGSSQYDSSNISSTWMGNYNGATPPGSNLVVVEKMQSFEGVHLVSAALTVPATGPMNRPAVADTYQVGNIGFTSLTPFNMPLASSLGAGGYRCNFTKVIEFDPEGEVLYQSAVNAGGTVPELEIGLQPVHGNNGGVAPAAPAGNDAAIQIDGTTGNVTTYRP